MDITLATEEDLYDIGKLGKAFVDNSISSKFITYNGPMFIDFLYRMLEAGIARLWVAKDHDKVIGAVCLVVSPNLYNPDEVMAEIVFIDVLPEYRKQGIAGELLAIAEDHCRKCKVTALSVVFKSKEIADHIINSHQFSMFEYKLMKSTKES